MLYDGQAVATDCERELERALVASFELARIFYLPVVLVDDLAILHDLLLSGEHRVIKLDCVVLVVEVELPEEKFLRPVHQ